jgi:hypothetical protein
MLREASILWPSLAAALLDLTGATVEGTGIGKALIQQSLAAATEHHAQLHGAHVNALVFALGGTRLEFLTGAGQAMVQHLCRSAAPPPEGFSEAHLLNLAATRQRVLGTAAGISNAYDAPTMQKVGVFTAARLLRDGFLWQLHGVCSLGYVDPYVPAKTQQTPHARSTATLIALLLRLGLGTLPAPDIASVITQHPLATSPARATAEARHAVQRQLRQTKDAAERRKAQADNMDSMLEMAALSADVQDPLAPVSLLLAPYTAPAPVTVLPLRGLLKPLLSTAFRGPLSPAGPEAEQAAMASSGLLHLAAHDAFAQINYAPRVFKAMGTLPEKRLMDATQVVDATAASLGADQHFVDAQTLLLLLKTAVFSTSLAPEALRTVLAAVTSVPAVQALAAQLARPGLWAALLRLLERFHEVPTLDPFAGDGDAGEGATDAMAAASGSASAQSAEAVEAAQTVLYSRLRCISEEDADALRALCPAPAGAAPAQPGVVDLASLLVTPSPSTGEEAVGALNVYAILELFRLTDIGFVLHTLTPASLTHTAPGTAATLLAIAYNTLVYLAGVARAVAGHEALTLAREAERLNAINKLDAEEDTGDLAALLPCQELPCASVALLSRLQKHILRDVEGLWPPPGFSME